MSEVKAQILPNSMWSAGSIEICNNKASARDETKPVHFNLDTGTRRYTPVHPHIWCLWHNSKALFKNNYQKILKFHDFRFMSVWHFSKNVMTCTNLCWLALMCIDYSLHLHCELLHVKIIFGKYYLDINLKSWNFNIFW